MTKTNEKPSVVIVTECPYSGVLRAILENVKILRELNFKIYFIVPATPRDRYGEKLETNIELLREFGEVLRSPLRSPIRKKYFYIREDKKYLEDLLSSFENYIVFSYAGYAGKLCRLLYKEKKISVLYHVPQCIDIKRRPFLQRLIESYFEHLLARHSTYYIACSDNEATILSGKFGVPSEKIISIPNFISKINLAGKQTKKYLFAILGRVSKDKRVGNILEVAKKINILDKFIVVGDGNELEPLKRSFPKVNFTGNIKIDAVAVLLSETKFIVSDSIIEGLPFAIIEAMHAGVVPIISDIPAHHDLITGVKDGFFFKDNSGLEKILLQSLVMDDAEYNSYSKNVVDKIKLLSNLAQTNFINHFKTYGKGN